MRRNRRGNQAIELGLGLPVLLFIFAGVVEYGFVMDQRIKTTMVARDAARAGSLVPLGAPVEPAAHAQGEASLAAAGLEGDVTCTLSGSSPHQEVRCETSTTYAAFFGMVFTPREIRSAVTMRMEEQP